MIYFMAYLWSLSTLHLTEDKILQKLFVLYYMAFSSQLHFNNFVEVLVT